MDPFDLFINPGAAQTTERGQDVRHEDVAKFAGIVRPKHPGGPWFEIGKNGLYVSVFIESIPATVQVMWGEPFARNGYGEINPPKLGTPVDVVFDQGIMVGTLGKTQLSEYNVRNKTPLHPRMLREWEGARLRMDGPRGNVRMVDQHQNVDEIVLGNQTKHMVGGESIVRQGPEISDAETAAGESVDHCWEATKSLAQITEMA